MSAPQRVLFVADAGRSVGGGHVMRCLTLADALENAGAECAFAATREAAELLDTFAPQAFSRFAAPSGDAAALCRLSAQFARSWNAGWAVIDHYGIGPDQDATLRAAAGRLLVMEDFVRARQCDLLLDSNLGRTTATYPGAAALAGPHYALVRPAFAARRAASLARRRAAGVVRRILIALGLTDVGGITGRAVAALLPVLGERQIEVVLGAQAPSLAELLALAERDRRITPHVNAKDMDALTADADIAIGAGGSSAWERCVLGLPGVTLILADNQRENTRALAAAGATRALEINAGLDGGLAAAFVELTEDGAARRAMSEAAAALSDGRGAARVAARMLDARENAT